MISGTSSCPFKCTVTYFLLVQIKTLLTVSNGYSLRLKPFKIFRHSYCALYLSSHSYSNGCPFTSCVLIGFSVRYFVELLILWERTDERESCLRQGEVWDKCVCVVICLVSYGVTFTSVFDKSLLVH